MSGDSFLGVVIGVFIALLGSVLAQMGAWLALHRHRKLDPHESGHSCAKRDFTPIVRPMRPRTTLVSESTRRTGMQ